MRYQGGKSRIAKHIASIINSQPGDFYLEPFVGGSSVLALVDKPNRVATDIEPNLIAMWKSVQDGWVPPSNVSRELYNDLRESNEVTALRGFVGYACSWGGKWFGGYASGGEKESHRNYAAESASRIARIRNGIMNSHFGCIDFRMLNPSGAVVYCDPPYKGTTAYSAIDNDFDHESFWEWCESLSKSNIVLVSECNAPDGWSVAWEKQLASGYVNDGRKKYRTERLFIKGMLT